MQPIGSCPPGAAGNDLLDGYFVAQADRPPALSDVDVGALTAYQRGLLVNDGTVTNLVEASVLEPVTVEVLDQQTVAVGDELASWLDLAAVTPVVRRRIVICGRRSGRRHAFAESLLVAARLPAEFISRLRYSQRGLGDLLAQSRLETRRELLWFGSAAAPAWVASVGHSQPLLTRSYRLIVAGSAAILITESFPQTLDR